MAICAFTLEKLSLLTSFPDLASLCRWPLEPFVSFAENSHSLLESHFGLDQDQPSASSMPHLIL